MRARQKSAKTSNKRTGWFVKLVNGGAHALGALDIGQAVLWIEEQAAARRGSPWQSR